MVRLAFFFGNAGWWHGGAFAGPYRWVGPGRVYERFDGRSAYAAARSTAATASLRPSAAVTMRAAAPTRRAERTAPAAATADTAPGRLAGARGGPVVPAKGPAMGFLIRLVVNAIALIAVAYVVPGIHVSGIAGALVAALVLGIVNAIVRPILIIVSLPLELLTLGLFTLVINALCFWLVGALHVGLYVDGFWPAFWGALVMTIVSWLLSLLTGSGEDRRRA